MVTPLTVPAAFVIRPFFFSHTLVYLDQSAAANSVSLGLPMKTALKYTFLLCWDIDIWP